MTSQNKFIQVNDVIYDIFEDLISLKKEDFIARYESKYDVLQLSNYYDTFLTVEARKDSKITPVNFNYSWDVKELKAFLSTKLLSVTLGLTEKCNFKCRYCLDLDKFSNNKKHSLKRMSFSVAKASIDYLLNNSADQKLPRVVAFYGGEPLLGWNLIKKILDLYGNQNNTLHYVISTNGSLLNKEIIDYFIKYSVTLIVSLDGPQNINDYNRIFKNSSESTFKSVFNKLNFIKKISKEYFENFVSCNSVVGYDVDIDFLKLKNFFDNNKLRCNISAVVRRFEDQQLFKPVNQYGYQEIKEQYYNSFINDCVRSRFVNDFFEISLRPLHNRNINKISDGAYRKTCIPGLEKLFVDSNGDFYTCEKLKNFESMQIGNFREGINIKRVYSLLNRYKKFQEKDCYDCWLIRLCNLCFYQFISNKKTFDINKKHENCKIIKRHFEDILPLYVSILEWNINALDFLKKESSEVGIFNK